MVAESSLEKLSKATLELYTPELHAGNWVEHAFRFLLAVVPADMANYGNLDPKTGVMKAKTTCDGSDWDRAVTGFGQCMKKYSFFNFDPAVNQGRPFFRSDFVSARQFRDLDIYTECFKILQTMDHAAVHVPTRDGRLAWFALERGGRRNFDSRDRVLLTLAQEHLRNSFQLATARQQTRDAIPCDPALYCNAGFTPRESEVAYWLTEGKTNGEIGILMRIQVQTVKGYLSKLFDRTGTGNRLALTLMLLELARTLARTENSFKLVPVRPAAGSRMP